MDVVVVGNNVGVAVAGGSLLVLMIEAPHSLHTYSRSSSYSYIYNAIQHLLQWLVVIRMLPHPDIGPVLEIESRFCWCSRWVYSVLLIEAPIPFILIPVFVIHI